MGLMTDGSDFDVGEILYKTSLILQIFSSAQVPS